MKVFDRTIFFYCTLPSSWHGEPKEKLRNEWMNQLIKKLQFSLTKMRIGWKTEEKFWSCPIDSTCVYASSQILEEYSKVQTPIYYSFSVIFYEKCTKRLTSFFAAAVAANSIVPESRVLDYHWDFVAIGIPDHLLRVHHFDRYHHPTRSFLLFAPLRLTFISFENSPSTIAIF